MTKEEIEKSIDEQIEEINITLMGLDEERVRLLALQHEMRTNAKNAEEKRWSESVKKAKIKNSKVYKGRVASKFGLLNKIVSIRKNRRAQNNDSKDI